MRVVSWNMGCGGPGFTKRYRQARDEAWRVLIDLAPDVVLVQEALFDVPDWVRGEGQLVVQPIAHDRQDAGTAVLVRGMDATVTNLVSAGSYIAAADVNVGEHSTLFASVHVDTTDQRPKLEALVETLRAAVAGRRFVIGGDFNAARHWDVVYKRDVYGWFFKALEAAGFHDCHFALNGKEVQSFWGQQAKEAYQLDHLFVPAAQRESVRKCWIVDDEATRRLSDHGPIVVDLA